MKELLIRSVSGLLMGVVLLICVFVLIAPSYLISHIHPAKSMRYE